jgi:hypothetical protein
VSDPEINRNSKRISFILLITSYFKLIFLKNKN